MPCQEISLNNLDKNICHSILLHSFSFFLLAIIFKLKHLHFAGLFLHANNKYWTVQQVTTLLRMAPSTQNPSIRVIILCWLEDKKQHYLSDAVVPIPAFTPLIDTSRILLQLC